MPASTRSPASRVGSGRLTEDPIEHGLRHDDPSAEHDRRELAGSHAVVGVSPGDPQDARRLRDGHCPPFHMVHVGHLRGPRRWLVGPARLRPRGS